MIVQTTINGRPATAAYLDDKFDPVDDENLATLVKVTFNDDEGGDLFLVAKQHSDLKGAPAPGTPVKARARAAVTYAVISARAQARAQHDKYSEDEPRDEHGR